MNYKSIIKSISLFFKANYLLIIGILIVSIYSLSPQFIFENKLGDDYQGIYFSATDSELYYTSRVQEIKDGYYGIGNSYLHENKNDPYLVPVFGEIIMAGFGKIFNLNIAEIMIYGSRLFFPILLFIAIYFFALFLQKDKKLALLSSIAIFLGSNIVYHFQDVFNIFKGFTTSASFSSYLQPINAQISSLTFFAFMAVFYLALSKKRTYLWILSALLLGIGFNLHFYIWAFILSFSFILIFFFLLIKDYERLKIIINTLSVGIILSTPYFFMLLKAMNTPQYSYAINNQGMISTHALILGKVALLTIIIFLFISKFFKLPKNLNYYFLLALALNTFVVINQQVITGKELYQSHFHFYYNTPVLFIIAFLALGLFLKKYLPKFKDLIIFLLIIFFVYNAFVVFNDAFDENFDRFVDWQKYGPIVQWINNNDLRDKVIVSEDLILDSIIPAYTSTDVYLAESASWYFVPRERIEHNYLTYLWLKGIKIDEIDDYFNEHKREISVMSSLDIPGKHYSCTDCITPQMIQYLSEKYKSFHNDGVFEQLIKYQADYLISSNENLSHYKFFEKINTINDFYIYKIIDNIY